MALAIYLWQTQVQALVASVLSGRDVLSSILAGGLVIMAAVPMILGLAIRAFFLVGAAARRLRALVQ